MTGRILVLIFMIVCGSKGQTAFSFPEILRGGICEAVLETEEMLPDNSEEEILEIYVDLTGQAPEGVYPDLTGQTPDGVYPDLTGQTPDGETGETSEFPEEELMSEELSEEARMSGESETEELEIRDMAEETDVSEESESEELPEETGMTEETETEDLAEETGMTEESESEDLAEETGMTGESESEDLPEETGMTGESEAGELPEETSMTGESETEESAEQAKTDKKARRFLVLVNKENPLPEDYTPDLLRFENSGKEVDRTAGKALRRMLSDGRKEGLTFVVASAYRDRAYQERLVSEDVAREMSRGKSYEEAYDFVTRETMPPGHSEHSTGLAVDLVGAAYQVLDRKQDEMPEIRWLQEHCAEYGFILRYPEDKEEITGISYEPWHFRYVGKKAAYEIMSAGITLEEYLMKDDE